MPPPIPRSRLLLLLLASVPKALAQVDLLDVTDGGKSQSVLARPAAPSSAASPAVTAVPVVRWDRDRSEESRRAPDVDPDLDTPAFENFASLTVDGSLQGDHCMAHDLAIAGWFGMDHHAAATR